MAPATEAPGSTEVDHRHVTAAHDLLGAADVRRGEPPSVNLRALWEGDGSPEEIADTLDRIEITLRAIAHALLALAEKR